MTEAKLDREPRGPLAEISDAIVKLHREHYGRGAVRARTIAHGDYAACFLEDILTTVEKTLVQAGRVESVRSTRLAFQDAVGPLFKEAVTKATGRRVVAFMSQVHIDPDFAVEAFVLEPSQDGAAGVSSLD